MQINSRPVPRTRLARSGRTMRIARDPGHDLRLTMAREQVEALMASAAFLVPADRELLEAVFGSGRSVVSVARLMGVTPKAARGRVRRLVDRINSPLFRFILRNVRDWDETHARVAVACIVQGRSIRGAARDLGLSFHRTRAFLVHTRMLFEAESAAPVLREDAA